MDKQTKRALWNAAQAIASLRPNESVTREELIESLRRPLPEATPSEAVIRHAYRHYVIFGGIRNAEEVVPYGLAAILAGSTIEAVRQAAYRGDLVKLTVFWHGKTRTGVTLASLRDWRRWSHERFLAASRQVAERALEGES